MIDPADIEAARTGRRVLVMEPATPPTTIDPADIEAARAEGRVSPVSTSVPYLAHPEPEAKNNDR